jgi:lipoprotein-anchoring transpeptidase ErfK/SrfK
LFGVQLNLSIASATNETESLSQGRPGKAVRWGASMHPSCPLAAFSAALLLTATTPQLAEARELVGFSDAYSSGTVVVKTSERALYYVLGNGKAVRYPVGVGRAGKQWTGTAMISGKQLSPAWSPPEEVKRDKPSLPNVIPGGSPGNPMGAAAMTLSGGGEYAIHGTNDPRSIGGLVSYGCIRMYNADVLDLYNRVGWGTTVVVTR